MHVSVRRLPPLVCDLRAGETGSDGAGSVMLVAGVGLVFVILLLVSTLWYARRLMNASA